MRKEFVTAIFTFMFCFIASSLFAETLEDRLNRLENEIKDLRTQAAQREAQLKELKTAQAEKAVAAPAQPASKQSVENLVWTKYNMRLYGRVKVDLNYDTAEFVRYNDFVGAVKAGASYRNDSVNFNPRDTRFGFEASHTDGDWTGLGRFEIDFYGTNSVNNLIPRMRLGYVNMIHNPTKTSILAGQDWIPVAQLNPNTVDFGILTAAGNLWWRVPQVTVRQDWCGLQFLLSAMKHRRQETSEENRMPWLLGRVAYAGDLIQTGGLFDKGSYVALGGGYRTDTVSKTTTDPGTRVERYLLAAELKLVRGSFTLQAEPWLGQGMGDEFLRYDLDVNTHASDSALPEPIWSIGGWVDLTYKATPKLSFTVGWGIDDPKDEDLRGISFTTIAAADQATRDRQFTMNQQIFVNSWYQLTKAIKVGAEIIHIKTERFNATNSGNRYTVSTFYEF